MFINIDHEKRPSDYKLHLAKPNKEIISVLHERQNSALNLKLGNISELNFSIPYFVEDSNLQMIKNPNIERIRELMYVKLTWGEFEEWFLIDNITESSEDNEIMNVQAFSIGYENKRKKINEFKETAINATEFYTEILKDSPWSIGEIDGSFDLLYRSFDESGTDRFELIKTGAETFGGVIVWDTHNKKINLKEPDNIGEFRGLTVSYDRLMSSLNKTRTTDEMVTRLYVYGNERITIENKNPTNEKYIEDYSYFMHPFKRDANKNVLESSYYMSDSLCHALLDNKELRDEYEPQIKTIQGNIENKNASLSLAMIELNDAEFTLMSAKGLLDIAKAVDDKALIEQRKTEVANATSIVNTKKTAVNNLTSQIEVLQNQVSVLQNAISVRSFTKELIDELEPYIIEKEIEDARYIDEDELYEFAKEKFSEIREPRVVIETGIEGLMNSVEEQYYWDKLVLGDTMRVRQKRMDIDYKSRIIEMNIGLDDSDVEVKIANFTENVDNLDKFIFILYSSESNSTILSNNKHKWDSVVEMRDQVTQLRDSEIDATKKRITAGVNESVEIGERGIVITTPSFPNEMIIMQAGVIALSEDGGETWKTSVTPNGVVAETVIGKLIAGNNLIITNDSGSIVMDGDGLEIESDSIKIMSGGENPKNLIDDWNNMIIDMEDFANDGTVTAYEKSQISHQWNMISDSHSKIIESFVKNMGVETPENPYPREYDDYLIAYENLKEYLFTINQSDGYTLLNPDRMDIASPIDIGTYRLLVRSFTSTKDNFILVMPMEYANAYMEVLESSISLNYVKNDEVVAKINLSEEGTRIDGKLLEINSRTEFNADLVMNAGLIQDANGDITIDLNKGEINLSKPLTINYIPIATKDDVENIEMAYIASLSNDTALVPTDASGDNGDYSSAFTSIHIYQRDIDVTLQGWTFSATPSIGVNGLLSGNDFTVTNMSVESGYVDVSAIKGSTVLTKRFSISKARKGETGGIGQSAKVIRLSVDKEVMTFNNDNTSNPANQTINIEAFIQGMTGNPTFTATAYNGNVSLGNVTTGFSGTGLKRTLSSSSFTANTTHITVTATLSGVTDKISIVKIKNGAQGDSGISPVVGYLTNEAIVLPANSEGIVSNYEMAEGYFRVFEGIIDVSNQAQATFSEVSSDNITINLNTSTGQYVVVDMEKEQSEGFTDIKATFKGVEIVKRVSVSKSKQGVRGLDGEDGYTPVKGADYFDGKDGANGVSSYLWVMYSQNANGNPMVDSPTNAKYIGVATTTINTKPTAYSDYKWSLVKGTDGVKGEAGADGKSSYMHIKYSDDGTTFTSNNGETEGKWIGILVDFVEADSLTFSDYTWNKVAGEDGSDAKLLYLSATAETMTFNADNSPNPTTQTISFTANLQNTTGTATFTATPYNGTTALTNITLGGSGNTRTLTQAQFPATATRILVKATLGNLTDTVSVMKLKNGKDGEIGPDGKNAVVGYLTNENITFPATSTGVVSSGNLALANGTFKVFDGLTEKTGSSVTYSVVSSTGATGAITTAGIYSVSAITADNASIMFNADYSGVNINKVLTLSKSKAGLNGYTPVKGTDYFDGKDGIDGTSSYVWVRYSQNADGSSMTTNPANALYMGIATTTVETAPESNNSYTWTLIKGTNGVKGETGSDGRSSYMHIKYSDNGTTFTANNGETEGKWIGIYVDFVEADSNKFSDYTWNKVVGEDGADAKLLYLSASAEAMTFNSNNTPNPATQTISFTANLQNITGTATFTAIPYNGTSAMTAITLGGSGNTRTLTQSQFPATATRIEIKAVLGGLVDTVSVVKLKNGLDGENSVVGYLTNESISIPTNSSGAFTPANLAKATGTFRVFDGLTEKTTDASVEFNTSTKVGLDGNITADGIYTVTALTADVATLELRATYKGVTIYKTLTVVKSRAGVDGVDGVSITRIFNEYAVNNSPAIAPTTGWDEVAPNRTSGQYLWVRERVNYSNSSNEITGTRMVTGDKGDTGLDGKNALSVMLLNESQSIATTSGKIATDAQIIKIPFTAFVGTARTSCTASVGTLPSGVTLGSVTDGTSSTDGVITLNVAKSATLGGTTSQFDTGSIEITITANNIGVKKFFNWTKSVSGVNGTTARTFFTESDVSVIVKKEDGSYTPSSFTFYSYYKDGNTANKTAYARFWKIETTIDGGNWTTFETKVDTASTTYTIASIPQNIVGIRATTYSTNALTSAHDTQSVMVVTDGESGISITNVIAEYSVNSSKVTAPTTGWQETQPNRPAGSFIWRRDKVLYSDDSVTTTNPVVMTGDKGDSGENAKLLYLSSNLENMIFNSDNTPNPSNQIATIEAKLQNVSGTIVYSATAYNGATSIGNVVLGGTGNVKTLSINNFPTNASHVSVTATLGSLTDTISIFKIRHGEKGFDGTDGADGQNAVVGILTNESITVPANENGAVTSFTGATGTFEVYDGTTRKTGSGVAYSVSGTPSGITVSINATTGVYTVLTMTSGASVLSGNATLQAIYNGVTIQKVLTVTKAMTGKTGATGSTGASGSNAKIVTLTSSAQIFAKNADGVVSPANITVEGASQNTSITTWEYSVDGGAFSSTLPTGLSRTGNVVSITGSSVTAKSISLRAKDSSGVSDVLSIAVVQDGAKGLDGSKGASGADAYTVVLSNESHTFAGNISNALAGSTKIDVIAYKGNTRVGATIGTISGLPTAGMTAPISGNGGTTASFTVSVTTSLTSSNGVLTIPITVDGKLFTKTFSYAISFKGQTGQTGQDGKGIQSTDVMYQNHTNGTTAPTGVWSSTVPAPVKGQYLWTRTITTYTDNSTIPTYSVAYSATDGENGVDGKGIVSTTVNYQLSSSGTVTPTGSWLTSVPTPVKGQYLWTRTVITYTSGNPSTSYSTSYYATDGQKGDKGDTGSAGADAKIVTVTPSAQIFARNAQGEITPSSITVDGTGQNTTISIWQYSVDGGTFATGLPTGVTRVGNQVTVNGSSMTAKTIAVKAIDSSGNSDTTTIAKVQDGSDGAKGLDGSNGADAYTVVLSNEAHTFAGNTSSAIASSVTVNVVAYKGTTRIGVTIGTISGAVEGMSTSIATNGTTTASFTVSVTTAMSTTNGLLTIPITVDGKLFSKTFSFALALKGADGANGSAGANAKVIIVNPSAQIFTKDENGNVTPSTITVDGTTQNVTISTWEYSIEGGAFSTSLPTGLTRSGNKVTITGSSMTAKNISVRASGSGVSDTTTIAMVQDGAKGSTGGTGAKGDNSIVGYLTNESVTLGASSTGVVSSFATASGTFRVFDGITEVTTNSSCVFSLNSSTGVTLTINSSGVYTVTAMSADTATAEFKAVYKGVTITKSMSLSKSRVGPQGVQGPQGATGLQGPRGDIGIGISSITEHYLATSASSGVTTATTGWTTTIQTIDATKRYLWNYEKINFSDGSNQPTIPVIIGVYGEKGNPGGAGPTGRSIVSITEHYLATSSSSGVTRSTAGWSTTMQTTAPEKRYLWNYETITWNSGTSPTYVDPIIIGIHGAQGPQGPEGPEGPNGISPIVGFLTNESITLPASDKGVVPSSSFASATGTLNVYEGTVLKNAQATYSVVSQSSITVGITQSGVYTVSAMTTGASVLSGTATLRAEYGGVTIDKILTVTKALAGTQGTIGETGPIGPNGKDATTYWINASTNAIKKDVTGTIVPNTITFSGFSKTGTSNPVAYAGRFIIQTSENGTSYTTRYTSSANQASYTYTIPATASFVKARYYLAGGTSVLLDEQTIPVLVDAEGIEVGGRNLLKNQKSEWAQLEMPASSYFWQEGSDYKVEVGQTYTFSVIVEKISTDTVPINIHLGLGSTAGSYTWDFPSARISNMPMGTKVFITFTVQPTDGASGTHSYFAWRLRNELRATTIRYKEAKLEKGNITTDWTEAPEDVQEQIGNKADIEVIDNLKNDLQDYTKHEDYLTGIGEVSSSIESYKSLLETIERDLNGERDDNGEFILDTDGNPINVGAIKEIEDIVERESAIVNNLGELSERWNFIGTNIIMASEGLLIGETEIGADGKETLITGIRVSKDRVDFVENKILVAEITGQRMKINRAIFVQSISVGEHKIETVSSGHTIWTWNPTV